MAVEGQRFRLWVRPRKRELFPRRARRPSALAFEKSAGWRSVRARPFNGQLGDARSLAPDGDPGWQDRAKNTQRHSRGAGCRFRCRPRANSNDGAAEAEFYLIGLRE